MRSIRKFKPDVVPKAAIDEIIEAGLYAASGMGKQAPIVLANKEAATYVYDGSLTLGNMMLAAHNLGVGSIWIHRAKEEFESEEGKTILADLGIEGIECRRKRNITPYNDTAFYIQEATCPCAF